MHINPSTDPESAPLDAEDWNIVFQPYSKFPDLALILAQHLYGANKLIEQGRAAEAMAGIDRAIECLMPHTRFSDSRYREIARKFYLQAVGGKLSTEQEDKLRELDLLE